MIAFQRIARFMCVRCKKLRNLRRSRSIDVLLTTEIVFFDIFPVMILDYNNWITLQQDLTLELSTTKLLSSIQTFSIFPIFPNFSKFLPSKMHLKLLRSLPSNTRVVQKIIHFKKIFLFVTFHTTISSTWTYSVTLCTFFYIFVIRFRRRFT